MYKLREDKNHGIVGKAYTWEVDRPQRESVLCALPLTTYMCTSPNHLISVSLSENGENKLLSDYHIC